MVQPSTKDILKEEIKSWERFEYALREENRLLFSKMLSEYSNKIVDASDVIRCKIEI